MTEQQKHRARIVRTAIETIEAKLEESEIKPTLSDLVKLLQIEKELEADEPREVRVRWVESDRTESLAKK
jgi:molybdopterin converting factor small subunit